MFRIAAVVALSLMLAGCATSQPTSPFPAALEHCKVPTSTSAQLGDHDQTLTIQGFGVNNPKGLVGDDVTCVLKALHVTDAVTQQIDGTRALDGMQSAKWGPISAKWTYHPDNGLRVILTTP